MLHAKAVPRALLHSIRGPIRCFYTQGNGPKTTQPPSQFQKFYSQLTNKDPTVVKTAEDNAVFKEKPSKIQFDRYTEKQQDVLYDSFQQGEKVAVRDKSWARAQFPDPALQSNKANVFYHLCFWAFWGSFVYYLLKQFTDVFGTDETDGLGSSDESMSSQLRSLSQMNEVDEPVERPETKFDDIKGLGEIRHQLEQVRDYIVNNHRYKKIGCDPPRGILLSGPPGVGKTLLGRALAGECGVPFYFISSASIDGMYVGTGSNRLAKLFKQARSHDEGAVIFLDEIDAIGGKRSAGTINPYSRLTINKLLAELDGFNPNDRVLVIASTNLPEVLDKALTRSGRFDQHISVPKPWKEDRIELLKYYLSTVVASPDIDIDRFASILAGSVGADFKNIVNTAAHRSAREGKDEVDNEDMEYAIKRMIFGTEQRGRMKNIPEIDLKVTAYREAGKALAKFKQKSKGKLVSVTIISRNGKAGKSKYADLEYDDNVTREDFLKGLVTTLAGTIAEEVITTEIFKNNRNQALEHRGDDFQSVKDGAIRMVSKFGMGEGEAKLMFHVHDDFSEYMKNLVEKEAQRIISVCSKQANDLVQKDKRLLKTVAEAILKYETLSGDEITAVLEKHRIDVVDKMRKEKTVEAEKRRKLFRENRLVDLDGPPKAV